MRPSSFRKGAVSRQATQYSHGERGSRVIGEVWWSEIRSGVGDGVRIGEVGHRVRVLGDMICVVWILGDRVRIFFRRKEIDILGF